MSSKQKLLPVALIMAIVLCWYYSINTVNSTRKEFQTLVSAGDSYAKDGVAASATEKYRKALDIQSDPALWLKLVKVNVEHGDLDDALEYAEKSYTACRNYSGVYEYLMEYYIGQKDYINAFVVYDQANGKKCGSDKLQECYRQIEYEFTLGSVGYVTVSPYQNGLCAVKSQEISGYLNESGGQSIVGDYQEVRDFMGNYACVRYAKGSGEFSDMWVAIDSSGTVRELLSGKADIQDMGILSEGIVPVYTSDSVYSYYNMKTGKTVGKFVMAGPVSPDGYAVVEDMDGYHLMTAEGMMGKRSFDTVVTDELEVGVRNGVFFARDKEGGPLSLYDVKYNVCSEIELEDAQPFQENGSLAAVKHKNAWGFMNAEGKMVIDPQYEEARSFSNGYAAVRQDGKWGFINESGELCVQPQFYDVKEFTKQGTVFVKQGSSGLWMMLTLLKDNHSSSGTY